MGDEKIVTSAYSHPRQSVRGAMAVGGQKRQPGGVYQLADGDGGEFGVLFFWEEGGDASFGDNENVSPFSVMYTRVVIFV